MGGGGFHTPPCFFDTKLPTPPGPVGYGRFFSRPRKKRQEQEEARLPQLGGWGADGVCMFLLLLLFLRGRRLYYGHVFLSTYLGVIMLLVCTVRLGVIHHDAETGVPKVINHLK